MHLGVRHQVSHSLYILIHDTLEVISPTHGNVVRFPSPSSNKNPFLPTISNVLIFYVLIFYFLLWLCFAVLLGGLRKVSRCLDSGSKQIRRKGNGAEIGGEQWPAISVAPAASPPASIEQQFLIPVYVGAGDAFSDVQEIDT